MTTSPPEWEKLYKLVEREYQCRSGHIESCAWDEIKSFIETERQKARREVAMEMMVVLGTKESMSNAKRSNSDAGAGWTIGHNALRERLLETIDRIIHNTQQPQKE